MRTRLYHPRETRVRDLAQLLALVWFLFHPAFLQFSPLKQVASDCQTSPWWLSFGLLCWSGHCLSTDALTQTSVSCSFCCSWTQLFLSLSPWALPSAPSRSVGCGKAGLLSPCLLVMGCRLPKVSHCLWLPKRAGLTEQFSQELLHFIVSYQHVTLSSLSCW